MTIRTASLLFLFVAAVGIAMVVTAMAVPLLARANIATPWVLPIIAMLCSTLVLFAGRRYILPQRLANAPGAAVVTLAALSLITLAAVVALRAAISAALGDLPGPWLFVLWFAALWLGIRLVHQRAARMPLR